MKCNFCQINIESLKDHLKDCTNAKNEIQTTYTYSLLLKNGFYICLRCGFSLKDSKTLNSHQKNCKNNSSKASSSKKESSIDIQQYVIPTEQFQQPATAKKIKRDSLQSHKNEKWQLRNQILQLNQSKMIIPIEIWCQRFKNLPKLALSRIYENYLIKCTELLQVQIPFIQIKDLYVIQKKIKWQQFIKSSQQIFCKQLITQRIQNKTQKEKIKIYSALNTIYGRYGKVFEKFKFEFNFQTQKATKPVKYKDFMCVIQKLFRLKKKGYVHLAIQLMIILLSRQRFPSMLKKVEKAIGEILKLRKKDNKQMSIMIKASKTGKQQQLIFTRQLLKLIQFTGWNKFSQNIRFYQRLGQILPFSCYSIRKTFFSVITVLLADSQLLKEIVGHSNPINSQPYIGPQKRASYIKLINKEICLPFLIQIGKQPNNQPHFSKLIDQQQLKSVIFPSEWFEIFLAKTKQVIDQEQLNVIRQDYIGDDLNIITQDNQDNVEELHPEIINQIQINTIEEIKICGLTIALTNGKFLKNQLYISVEGGLCSICEGNIAQGWQCRFCQSYYHFDCSKLLCSCYQANDTFSNVLIQKKSLNKNKTIIKMPQQYFNSHIDQIQQIRAIIHLRGFRFTSSYVISQKAMKYIEDHSKLFDFTTLQNIKLKRYQQYLEYKYFPPLRFGIYGDNNQSGSGFGLYATQQISRNTFIGQYGCDLYLRLETYRVARKDCILSLIEGQQFQGKNSLDLGPITCFSYILLINSSEKPNCGFKKCLVNDRVSVITYTLRKILPGEQLLINYKLKTQIIYDQEEEVQLISEKTKRNTENCVGIKNIGNTCYLSASLQLLKKVIPSFICDQNSTPIHKQIHNFIHQENIYDPTNLLKLMVQNSQFSLGQQEDSSQAFTFLLNQMYKDEDINNTLEFSCETTVRCYQCETLTTNSTKQMTIHLNSAQIVVQSSTQITDFDCKKCQKKVKAQIMTKYSQFNNMCLFTFKKFGNNNEKIIYNSRTPQKIQLNQITYEKIFYVLHLGQNMGNGHYIAVDIQQRVMFNDEKIQTREYEIKSKDIYMVAYKRV